MRFKINMYNPFLFNVVVARKLRRLFLCDSLIIIIISLKSSIRFELAAV